MPNFCAGLFGQKSIGGRGLLYTLGGFAALLTPRSSGPARAALDRGQRRQLFTGRSMGGCVLSLHQTAARGAAAAGGFGGLHPLEVDGASTALLTWAARVSHRVQLRVPENAPRV